MKRLIIFLLLLVSSSCLLAQQVIPFKSLTIGNRFVYKYFAVDRTFSPKDTVYRYYEDVLRDTIINGKRFAVIFSSFDRSLHYERSDRNNLYVWRNEREELWHSLDFKQNDTTRFSFLGFNADLSLLFAVDRPNKAFNSASGDTVGGYNIRYNWGGFSTDDVLIAYVQKQGLTQVDFYRDIRNFPTRIISRQFQGGIIDGVVVRDTSTQRTIVSVNGDEIPGLRGVATLSQPNPFSESANLSYNLSAAAQDVELRITAMNGETLTIFKHGAQGTGAHSMEWNGKTADGRDVPQGAYIVSLYVNGRKQSDVKIVKAR